MKLKDMPPEEVELLSYTDLTYILIKENNKAMNTPTIFKKIAALLEYTDLEYAAKIGDYYTSLTIDKRFVLLENNEWDIRDRHSISIVVDDDDDEMIEDIEEVIPDETEDEENEIIDDDEDPDEENDLDDLSIISEDEE